MELWFLFLAGGLFLLSIMIYVGIMIFYPEWVGITGKKALEAERSHRGDAAESSLKTEKPESVDSGPASEAIQRLEQLPLSKEKKEI